MKPVRVLVWGSVRPIHSDFVADPKSVHAISKGTEYLLRTKGGILTVTAKISLFQLVT